MTLESVVTRLGIPMDRPFHDALSDTLYTADVCRKLHLREGLAAYPTEDEALRQSLCQTPGDYRDFKIFRGYVEQYAWRVDPKISRAQCPVCGADLTPDDIWLKRGSNSWYTLAQCPRCAGTGSEAGKGVFQRYKLARRDGLHWSFAAACRCPRRSIWPAGRRCAPSRSSGCRPARRSRPPKKQKTDRHRAGKLPAVS